MTECTPSHCHHHSLSAHLLLKGWNVSGASSWWGITLQRGATPLWYKPPFNTCTPHSKKTTKKKQGYVRSVPVFLGSSGDTYHRGGNGLTSKWLLMQIYTHKTHFSVNYAAEDKENSAETARPVVPWSIRTPLWLYQLALPALKKSDLSALYASKGLCFSKQVRRGPLTAY